MTRQEVKAILPILQAYAEGKTIQVVDHTDGCGTWEDVKELNMDESLKNEEFFSLRIKPSPTYRPFANAEECWKEMLKHQPFGWVKRTINESRTLVTIVRDKGIESACCYGCEQFADVFNSYTFADGSVFGVEEEE